MTTPPDPLVSPPPGGSSPTPEPAETPGASAGPPPSESVSPPPAGAPHAYPPPGHPTPGPSFASEADPTLGGSPPPEFPLPEPGRNGLAIAGLILAFLFAPVGFVLSLIGFIQTGKRRQKGRGMALAGMILGFTFSAIGLVILIMVGVIIGKNVGTLADPGCAKGKEAILSSTDMPTNDAAALRAKLQNVVTGLNAAADTADHDNVRQALKAVSDDYAALVKALDTGTSPPADLETKTERDGNRVDELCTIGGAANN